jgi:ribonuclease BN (tRNA processing enzyme)
MRLRVIGGSGGYPGLDRPCSGYLIEAERFTLLIDPGYGVATAVSPEVVSGLDAVLISHAHPDHCADLNPILRARAWADDPLPQLAVYALPGTLDAVLALDRPEVLAGSYVLKDLASADTVSIGPFEVQTALLPHPRPNLGFRITNTGRSLVYTGDCGPSEKLVKLADGADLLLAEASYAESVHPDTLGALSSAADVGREATAAGVRRLVLTHLMPKTDEADALAVAARHFGGPIEVARPGVVVDAEERRSVGAVIN